MKIDSDIIQENGGDYMTEDIKQKPRGFKGLMEDLGVSTFDELNWLYAKQSNWSTCPGVGRTFK